MSALEFQLNGRPLRVDGIDPNTTLLDFLRERGLTGSKEGCAEGECGACAVAVVRPHGASSRFEAVNACLYLLPSLHDAEVWTVEGIGNPESLHPAQAALLQGGSQCGYCTPGFAMSLFCAYHDPERQGPIDLEMLGGNLCRCTGYRPIRDAALSLGPPEESHFTARVRQAAPDVVALEYAALARRFDRPGNLNDLFTLLKTSPEAKLIAGGTDTVTEMNLRQRRHAHLISLEALPELQVLRWADETLEFGAGLTLTQLEAALGESVPMLAKLFPLFASRLIRNRATLGGNLGTASPIGDSAPALLALDARLRLASKGGERIVPLKDFFTGFRQTALLPAEIIVSVLLPRPFPQHQGFYKIAKRGRDDISTVALGIALELSDGVIQNVRLGLGGVAATPARAPRTEAYLTGKPWTRATMREAGSILQSEFRPLSDHRGSAAYRSAMLANHLERFWAELEVSA